MPTRLQEILARMAEIRSELLELEAAEDAATEEEPLPDDHSERVATLVTEFDSLEEERAPLQKDFEQRQRIRGFAADPRFTETGDDRSAPQFMKRVDPVIDNIRSASDTEVRDAAMKTIERDADRIGLSDEVRSKLDRDLRAVRLDRDGDVMFNGPAIARRLLYTERPAYRSAFMKAAAFTQPMLDADEVRAIQEMRVDHQSLTNASGGYGVPVLIDPTIILTTGAADVPILRVARVETITTNEWKGVSSTPTEWSYDAEGATVSDDDIELAQPTVTTHMARSFVRHTIEIGMDYPNFAMEFGRAIAAGYLQLIASQSMTGSGSAPIGIFTAIDATAAREVVVTTSGALGPEDIFTVWNHLGELWRSRASWFSSVSVESQVRQNGAVADGLYSVDLTADGLVVVNGRPWYKTDYAPAFTGTTGTVNLLVVGDFSNYLIAQRAGMSVEQVPHIFDVTNNRPTGERGLFAWARNGMDSINDNAFALLKNAT